MGSWELASLKFVELASSLETQKGVDVVIWSLNSFPSGKPSGLYLMR